MGQILHLSCCAMLASKGCQTQGQKHQQAESNTLRQLHEVEGIERTCLT